MKTITASVGFGGRNLTTDTRTVQELLNNAQTNSGQPPIAVDGIVGPKTIGAIREFQQSRLGFNDGRVDPGGPTIRALNALQTAEEDRVHCKADDLGGGQIPAASNSRFGLAGQSVAERAPAPKTPKDVALENKAEALLWLGSALAALQTVRSLMATGLTANFQKLETMLEFQALKTHFHIDRHPNPLQFLSELGKTYSFMNIAVSGGETSFANDFASDDFANSDPGGFARRNDQNNPGRMFFCPKYTAIGALSKVVTIVHEAAHYVDKKIDHFASAVPFPDGRPLTGTQGQAHSHNYAQMTPDEAQQNAASYAGFAIHVNKRQDTRPTITQ
jgi:hypothetical protein